MGSKTRSRRLNVKINGDKFNARESDYLPHARAYEGLINALPIELLMDISDIYLLFHRCGLGVLIGKGIDLEFLL